LMRRKTNMASSMRKLIVMSAVLAVGAVAFAADEEMVDNPVYKIWSSFKVGAMAKTEAITVAGEMKTKTEMTSELKELTAEKAVVEVKMAMVDAAGKKMELPAQKTEIPAKVAKSKVQATKPDTKEGEEEIEVAGKKLKCKWIEMVIKMGEMTSTSKVWTSSEIPGSVAKMESKTEGNFKSETKMIVVEFKTGA